ncbi:MAG: hypothetical protein ACHQHN_02925 [Sphingobacteriales bacterium]
MNKFYLPLCLFGAFLLTSCSPHLVTQGIKDKTSNYVVTTDGKKINASSVIFNTSTVAADTANFSIKNISAIKVGPAYYGVKNGVVYDGVYYGKLMLLRHYWGTSYDMNTHMSHPIYAYYLQKEGQSEIVDMTGGSVIDYVQDNPLALRKARAARIYSTVNTVSVFTTIVGLGCVFLPYSSKIRNPAVTIGLFSMPTFLITLPIGPHKRYKSIIVYNR